MTHKGLFAESPVSTGMRGPSDADGRFQRHPERRFHRSNIYSGAPMPYMQRITWSGLRCTRACSRVSGVARLHPYADELCR